MKNVIKIDELTNKAEKYFADHESVCNEMLKIIMNCCDDSVNDLTIFRQAGDGYVILTDCAKNIPVSDVVYYNHVNNKLLSKKELYKLAI